MHLHKPRVFSFLTNSHRQAERRNVFNVPSAVSNQWFLIGQPKEQAAYGFCLIKLNCHCTAHHMQTTDSSVNNGA